MRIRILTRLQDVVIVPFLRKQKWDGLTWITLTDIHFRLNGRDCIIEAGFVTDLGSVPRLARAIVNRAGKGLLGFVIHDWMYGSSLFKRKLCDEALYILHKRKTGYWEAKAVYLAVRVGGGKAFDDAENFFVQPSLKTIEKILTDNGYDLAA